MAYLQWKCLIPNVEFKGQYILINKTVLHLKILIPGNVFCTRCSSIVCPLTLHISFDYNRIQISVTGEEKASNTKEDVWYVERSTESSHLIIFLFQQFSPSFVKESPHVVSGSSDFWIVFVEFFTIIKNQVHVNDECLQIQVPEIIRNGFTLNVYAAFKSKNGQTVKYRMQLTLAAFRHALSFWHFLELILPAPLYNSIW